MARRVRKAVLPVAGLGTRVLPGAKTTPKNLLNVVDRPILSYIVEEARAAGIEHFVFIVGRGQGAIEDYFDALPEVEQALEAKGKLDILEDVRRDLPQPGQMSFVRQMAPLGLGHAVWCARDVVGDEPFAVMLPDDLIWNKGGDGALKQMVDHAAASGAGAIAVQDVPKEQTASYGIVATDGFDNRHGAIRRIVEKPRPEDAPSTLAVVGRYVLPAAIFDHLERTGRGAGGEIQLTDAIASLLDEQRVDAYRFQGTRFDCGTHIGLVEATIRFALDHEKISDAARESMARALQELGVIDLD
jgi:UTP--glucose-1-phosphate uridylyltransferase